MIPVILTAFSTASSASTIPVALEEVEKTSGVSNKIASFTISLGAIINMSGTALYECVVVLFIAQVYGVVQGIHFGIWDQLFVAVLSLLTSIGLAGVPSAGLVAITVILGLVGLPVEAVGVIWTVERVLDMMRTAVNVFSDTCGAIVIARSEGEITNYRSIK
jgi:Na+/H+-dicarboxylate symporter